MATKKKLEEPQLTREERQHLADGFLKSAKKLAGHFVNGDLSSASTTISLKRGLTLDLKARKDNVAGLNAVVSRDSTTGNIEIMEPLVDAAGVK